MTIRGGIIFTYYLINMLNLNSLMLGSQKPKEMAEFYKKVFARDPDMQDGDWSGWRAGNVFLTIGEHSEVGESAKEPARSMFVLEAEDVKAEFERIKGVGAKVIKDPYEMGGMWIATFADPDGNYFQLMSPWEESK
jgi:predicted enzyme related to lactoylglutathione lyase